MLIGFVKFNDEFLCFVKVKVEGVYNKNTTIHAIPTYTYRQRWRR